MLATAARNAPDSGTPEGRQRQLDYLDAAIAEARPDVQLDRLMLVSVFAQRGAVLAEAGDIVAAREAVARSLADWRADDPPLIRFLPLFVEALITLREEHWQKGLEQLRALDLKDLPVQFAASAHALGGVAYYRIGELEGARRELRTAVDLKPDRGSLLLLGQVELVLEDPASARDLLLRATQDFEGADAEVLAFLSHAERLLHHDTKAIERAREAIAADDQDATAHLALGAALASAGRWRPALLALEQGLRVDPPRSIHQQLWLNRLVVLARLDRYEEVATAASSPPELDEAASALLAECHAGALDRLGRRAEAISVLRRASGNPQLSSAMRRVLAQADGVGVRHDSWLGFWFGPGTSGARKVIGAALVIVAVIGGLALAINPDRVGWLSWRASGAEAALSVGIVAVLFLIPLATSLKVAGVEIEVPAAPEPVLDPIDPVAISRVLDDAVMSLFVRAQRLPAGKDPSPTTVAIEPPMGVAVSARSTGATGGIHIGPPTTVLPAPVAPNSTPGTG
jgi:tetratricopeptide (TPR) repeat protein